MKTTKLKFFFIILLILIIPFFIQANPLEPVEETVRGIVNEVMSEKTEISDVTNTKITIQKLRIGLLDEKFNGKNIIIENDYIRLKENQKIFLKHVAFDDEDIYSVAQVDRTLGLIIVLLLFLITIIIFSGKQGLRSIISLFGSFLIIFYILLPLLLAGYSPIFVSVIIATTILAIAIFFTHGKNLQSLIAFSSAMIAIIITGLLTYLAMHLTSLTGFFSDETIYLNINTQGILDFKGLLMAGIIISILGILDDIAITQVEVVAQLKSANKKLSEKEIYKRALKVGKEHIGALINTLILAYAGISLPLLLLISQTDYNFLFKINQEMFATEIIRTLIGSIGLILTVPITTYLATLFIKNK